MDPAYAPYIQPGRFAKLPSGETIHLKCAGTGSPTVILSAGLGDWSAVWRNVQPQVAKTTRVCAWDRPGFGFSSGSARPQTVFNTAAELEAALKAARLTGPYVLVGHSLGSYESLLFKDHQPHAVVGMVLVDPSFPDQPKKLVKVAPALAAASNGYLTQAIAMYDRCIASLRSGKLKPGSPDPDKCWSYPDDYPPELTGLLVQRDTDPLRFEAVRSYVAGALQQDGQQVINTRRNYGSMPLIILTAGKTADIPGIATEAKNQIPVFHAEWVRAHDEIAALSSRGANRMVPEATHYIQQDKPQAVIEAIEEVLTAVRRR
jgi:pimeloyl-ACP methyl ester carboxylesterase